MMRSLVALILCLFLGLYSAVPVVLADAMPEPIVSTFIDEGAHSVEDLSDSVAPDSSAECDDICNWLAAWHVALIPETLRSPVELPGRALPSGFIAALVPPPR